MAKPGPTVKTGQGSAINVVTVNETILAQVNVSVDNASANILLEGNVDITTGAATTALTVQVRRGATLAGPVVGVAEVPGAGAAARVVVPLQVIDSPGEVAGQVYSLTVTQTAATGNGTVNSASLTATY